MSFLKNIFDKVSTLWSRDTESSVTGETIDGEMIDSEFLENLEEALIRSDLGVSLAMDFTDLLRKKNRKAPIEKNQAPYFLREFLLKAFESDRDPPGSMVEEKFKIKTHENTLSIYLFVGVNGSGKTTSIGKLSHRFRKMGKRVLIAAGDTFRAAAGEQLRVWAMRSDSDLVETPSDTKPSAVVFKAIEKALSEKYDILLIDTAGRLENRKNLMQELAKIREVIDHNAPNMLCETFLVLDSGTGQNALSQARNFLEICDVSSIFLSKFDSSAKAGMVFAIAYELRLPVKLIGSGEGIEDLEDFDPDRFIQKYL